MQELLTTPTGALALWLVFINAATFAVYGVDKRRARRGAWRIPEKTLFLLPLLGGSVGALAGMRVFHHKTKHWYFVWGIPLILLAQMALAVWLLARESIAPIIKKSCTPRGTALFCYRFSALRTTGAMVTAITPPMAAVTS